MHIHPRAERRILALILTLFLLLGFCYALVTPVFEASDELWHYPMVRHLADGNPLPVQVFDPALAGPWNQEASQPPLYYYLAAALTFWIDTSDMEAVRWLNPHVDNGVITPDGNIGLVVHDPAADPWSGTLLAVRLIRLASVLLGAATVYLTYRLGREVALDRPAVGLLAAALNAFLPMFLFISGAVNNDNLAVPLASLALVQMVRIVRSQADGAAPARWRAWLALGVVIGLAVLTKEGTLALLPMALGTAVVSAWHHLTAGLGGNSPTTLPQRSPVVGGPESAIPSSIVRGRSSVFAARHLLIALALIALPVALIAGWWYYRNIALYGDWLGWNAFIAVLGQRATPASLVQLWGERRGFLMSFWGLFGGVNVPMSAWMYTALNAFLVLGVAGFVVYVLRLLRAEWRLWRTRHGTIMQRLLWAVERNFGLIVCLTFSAAVVYGLIQWATTTWSSQGRLVFTAISPLCVLLALGWSALVDWRRLPRAVRATLLAVPAVLLLLVAAAAPWLWIRPAYIPPVYPGPLAQAIDVTFGDDMRLAGYEIEREALRPGDSVRVRLEWEALRPMVRDWSVFVHLNDPVLGQPIAQRDMFPGQGLVATRFLSPGQRLVNEYVLTVPATAVAPADLALSVGLYDAATGERLPAAGGDAATLTTIPLSPHPGEFDNPTSIFFEHGLELVGFAVEPRHVMAGDTLEVVTQWRPSEALPDDFTFFAQVVGEDTTRYAALDAPPATPTNAWSPGKVYEVRLPLTIDPAAPPGVYPLIVGLYTRTADGGFDRLQLVTADGRLTDDFLTLTPVRIDAP